MKPVIFALSGLQVTDAERAFLSEVEPAGFILFGRNIDTPEQVRVLTDTLRSLTGRINLPILIDQEGGVVARLRKSGWPEFPGAPRFGEIYEKAPMTAIEAARCNAVAIGLELAALGINVNCMPVLDRAGGQTAKIIASRSYGRNPLQIAALGRATLNGLAEAGVIGVIKHLPGQGLAQEDTHLTLSAVTQTAEDLGEEITPFRHLADAKMGMVGHALYTAWDNQRPASQSSTIIGQVIRGEIGFGGILMTDDIEMNALSGTMADRVLAALSAGCDMVLHCSGELNAMREIAAAVPDMNTALENRLESVMSAIEASQKHADSAEMRHRVDKLMAMA